MTSFRTRKRDKQVFPTDRKTPRDSGSASFVGVDKSQIEKPKKSESINKRFPIYALEDTESYGMTEKEVIALWQYGVDTGMVWRLQGWYGRNAQALLDEGVIKYPRKHKEQSSTDYYGKSIPTHAQAKKLKLYKKDSDKDGVPDSKDCKPFNPKKQGFLHDTALKLLKQREQSLENKRLDELRKLEETKERLQQQQAIQSVKNAKLQQKQAIINEINLEKKKIAELQEANKQAKKEIFDASPTGKTIKFSSSAIKKTQEFLNRPKTKKSIKRIFGSGKTSHKSKKTISRPYITI